MADVATLALPAVFDGAAAAALCPELLACRGKPLAIDAGNVERAGTLGLQVLMAAAKTWAADGQPFDIADSGPAIDEAATLLGIDTKHLPRGVRL